MVPSGNELIALLAQRHSPFTHLSEQALAGAAAAVRAFRLYPGETLAIGARTGEGWLWLLEGEMLPADGRPPVRAATGGEPPQPLPVPALPATLRIEARTPLLLCQAEAEEIDLLVSWDELGRGSPIAADPESARRFQQVRRNCLAFRHLPVQALEELFRRLVPVTASAGQAVVTQGEAGDAFYVLVAGRAEVWRQGPGDDAPRLIDTIAPGEGFGEDSLVAEGRRNATVRMTTDGELLRLSKTEFNALVAAPGIEMVPPAVARRLLDAGHPLLDVRFPEEFAVRFVSGARLLPLPYLRQRVAELDPRQEYLVMCESGRRAAVAALLLRERGITARCIAGGLRGWPYETRSHLP